MEDSGDDVERPFLRVVRGDPTPEELAALVAVVAAQAGAASAEDAEQAPSPWSARGATLHPVPHPGPGAWRSSAGLPGTRTRAAL